MCAWSRTTFQCLQMQTALIFIERNLSLLFQWSRSRFLYAAGRSPKNWRCNSHFNYNAVSGQNWVSLYSAYYPLMINKQIQN